MDYVSSANRAIREELSRQKFAVVFGQNVDAGSRLGGLAKGLSELQNCTVINTPNCENGLVGLGFGLMLEGTSSMFMMKQQDFLLLGVDQMFNTWSALRERKVRAPFVICTIVVDSGWEGPQSSFNNSAGLSQLCRIPVFTPASADQLEVSVRAAFGGGPAILAISQRLFKDEAWAPGGECSASVENGFSGYRPPNDSIRQNTVVISANFAFPQGREVAQRVGACFAHLWRPDESALSDLVDWASRFDEAIIIDDSKSLAPIGERLSHEIGRRMEGKVRLIHREDRERWHLPGADQLSLANDAATRLEKASR